jgi:hypothetical protein
VRDYFAIAPGRWAFLTDFEASTATLSLRDEATRTDLRLADRVHRELRSLNLSVGSPMRGGWLDAVVFRTVDDDGRSTLWRADLDRLE